MRSEREIREKIASLDRKRCESCSREFKNDPELEERFCLQIDMLLWILEDNSGFPPLDER